MHPFRSRGLRRLAVLALAPFLALSTTTASAQGVWVSVPPMPTARAHLAGAAAKCPQGFTSTCVYAVGGTEAFDVLEAYSPASNTWISLPAMPTAREGITATTAPCPNGVQGDCLYTAGGVVPNTDAATTTVEAYSTATNTWITLPGLKTPRTLAASATGPCPEGLGLSGSCVYVFGGQDVNLKNYLTSVEAFSPKTGVWVTLAPLTTARAAHAGATAPCPAKSKHHGTCVYAIGGRNDSGKLKSVEVYSPTGNAWSHVPDMPTARDELAASAAPCPDGMKNTCVYAMGGGDAANSLRTFEAYSPATNAWSTLPQLPTPHRGFAGATAPCPKNTKSPCVYAAGGALVGAASPTGATEAFAIEWQSNGTGGNGNGNGNGKHDNNGNGSGGNGGNGGHHDEDAATVAVLPPVTEPPADARP
ncbi:Kelch repeat-containing protein [Streptomyces sp. NPDC101132]|uniref:Kelch repeat-containing protein n=1 Tax=Streptomyces sp. NPDC101132 TaxID=3366110 RepID=UPI0037F66D28